MVRPALDAVICGHIGSICRNECPAKPDLRRCLTAMHAPDTGPGKRVTGAGPRTGSRKALVTHPGGSPVRQRRTPGSVRGARGNPRPYRDRNPKHSPSRSRAALLRHAGQRPQGGLTQTNQPPAIPGRFILLRELVEEAKD